MSQFPSVSGKKVFRALTRNGYVEIRTASGSHRFLKHTDKGNRVTIPYTNHDLPKGTLKSILNQAGITVEELMAML